MPSSAPTLAIEILDEAAFRQLDSEWSELVQRSYDNRFFSSPSWYRLWWRHFGESAGQAIVTTARGDQGTLVGILPLRLTESAHAPLISLAGDPSVSDYMDAHADRQQAPNILRELWSATLGSVTWQEVELRHVPSASPLISALQAACEERGDVTAVSDDEVCPVAILCGNWDGYLQTLGKKQRHEIRRKLRRAQDGADWTWTTVRSEQELDGALSTFFRLHEASAHDKARFMTPSMRDYFRDLAAHYLDEDSLRLSIFAREGRDLAATMSFVHRDRYLLYNSGYDPEYAAFSPGIAAVALAMQDAIEEQAVAFDFLSGGEPYKYQFGATSTYTCRVTASRS